MLELSQARRARFELSRCRAELEFFDDKHELEKCSSDRGQPFSDALDEFVFNYYHRLLAVYATEMIAEAQEIRAEPCDLREEIELAVAALADKVFEEKHYLGRGPDAELHRPGVTKFLIESFQGTNDWRMINQGILWFTEDSGAQQSPAPDPVSANAIEENRKVRVDAFIEKVQLETGHGITPDDISLVSGYKDRTTIADYQRGDCTPRAERKFASTLQMESSVFLASLNKAISTVR